MLAVVLLNISIISATPPTPSYLGEVELVDVSTDSSLMEIAYKAWINQIFKRTKILGYEVRIILTSDDSTIRVDPINIDDYTLVDSTCKRIDWQGHNSRTIVLKYFKFALVDTFQSVEDTIHVKFKVTCVKDGLSDIYIHFTAGEGHCRRCSILCVNGTLSYYRSKHDACLGSERVIWDEEQRRYIFK